MKGCQDDGIDLALLSRKLKILNSPEDSANDLWREALEILKRFSNTPKAGLSITS